MNTVRLVTGDEDDDDADANAGATHSSARNLGTCRTDDRRASGMDADFFAHQVLVPLASQTGFRAVGRIEGAFELSGKVLSHVGAENVYRRERRLACAANIRQPSMTGRHMCDLIEMDRGEDLVTGQRTAEEVTVSSCP